MNQWKWLVGALCAGAVSMAASTARAEFRAYEVTAPATGTQAWPGSLGLDFDVVRDVYVYELGVFDSGQDGLAVPLAARIFDRDTQAVVVTVNFAAGMTGTLVNGHRYLPLPCPLKLPAGFHGVIEADGYGATELNGNTGGPAGKSTNDGGGAIAFLGGGRYSFVGGDFPNNVDGGPADRYAAGTFVFAEACANDGACTNAARPKCGGGGLCGQANGAFFAACTGATAACDLATATCAACDGNLGAGGATKACAGPQLPACTAGACVECNGTLACAAGKPVCNGSGVCTVCTQDFDSPGENVPAGDRCGSADDPFCKANGSCGKCATDQDCANRAGRPFCTASGACSKSCASDAQCGTATSGKICSAQKTCVSGCAVAGDSGARNGCPAGQICTAKSPGTEGTCTTACTVDAECAAALPEKPYCQGTICVACRADADCGSGKACNASTKTCEVAADGGASSGGASSGGASSGGASSGGASSGSGGSSSTSSGGTDDGGCSTSGSSGASMAPLFLLGALAIARVVTRRKNSR